MAKITKELIGEFKQATEPVKRCKVTIHFYHGNQLLKIKSTEVDAGRSVKTAITKATQKQADWPGFENVKIMNEDGKLMDCKEKVMKDQVYFVHIHPVVDQSQEELNLSIHTAIENGEADLSIHTAISNEENVESTPAKKQFSLKFSWDIFFELIPLVLLPAMLFIRFFNLHEGFFVKSLKFISTLRILVVLRKQMVIIALLTILLLFSDAYISDVFDKDVFSLTSELYISSIGKVASLLFN